MVDVSIHRVDGLKQLYLNPIGIWEMDTENRYETMVCPAPMDELSYDSYP